MRILRNNPTAASITAAFITAGSIAALALPAPASAFRLDRGVAPQPVLKCYVRLADWHKPFDRVAIGFSARELPRAHVYTKAGEYTAKLQVVDYYGRRTTSRVTVTVAAAP